MGAYLDARLQSADKQRMIDRAESTPPTAQQSLARQQQVADEESQSQPDIAAPNYVAPEIPVVGPLSAVASMAVSSGAPTGFTYQWLRDGSVISGATSASYTLVEADRTKAISLAVIATKSGETSAPAMSAATAAVRRTAATIGVRYGRLSRTGYGKVALASSL